MTTTYEGSWTYLNQHGFGVVVIADETSEAYRALGMNYSLTIPTTGEMAFFGTFELAQAAAQALAAHTYADYIETPDYSTCAEDMSKPRIKDGVFMNGHFAGLPAVQKDGVWGVDFFEVFWPWR